MSVRRALVDCVVLSLQDTCVFYPCCKGCFSRIHVEQDTTRCRCFKCGYSCQRDQVDYRYRLSLRVARDTCIFGVTVFGTSLNPFFGIHASGLQRLVENLDGASTRSTYLVKAVEDCFIGKHFIFGIKVTETESGPWLGGPVVNGTSSKEAVHFIANQMILPKATGLGGCTVVSYYQTLLKKAAEYELGSTDPGKTSGPPAKSPLLITRHFLASSFNNATLSASNLLSQSLQSSQYQDGALTPTPPWQQSLGLVTSSAEQDEGCSTQDSGDESSRQTDNNKTPCHAQRGYLETHKVTEKRALSSRLSLDSTFSSSQSFAKYPYSSIEKAAGNTPILNTCFSPLAPGLNISPKTYLSSSLAWEDLPFSESLTEYLCEKNTDFNIVSQTKPHLNVQNQKETVGNILEIKNVSHKSTSVYQSTTQITEGHSQILLDVINTSAANGGHGHDLSVQVHKNSVRVASKSEVRNIFSDKCIKEEEKASSLSFENEEEQLEADTYNCSADLFSNSLMLDMNTNKLNNRAETVQTTTEARPLLSKPNKQHPRIKQATHSTPDKQKLESDKCMNREHVIPKGTQDLDFIPLSQSTPIVVTGSHPSSHRTLTFAELGSQPDSQDSRAFDGYLSESDSKTAPSLCRLNCVSSREPTKENIVWSMTSWEPDKHKNPLLAQQHPRVQRGALNTGSAGRFNNKCNSSDCDVYHYEDNEVVVPPTPARLNVKLRRRRQSNYSSSNVGYSWEWQQGEGVNCKRTLLDARAGNCDSETVDEGSPDGAKCHLDDKHEACDWSRDLFSDSI